MFVEFLLGGFLPREDEVAHGGNETEADGAAWGKEEGAVERGRVGGAERVLDGRVGEVARGENVGDVGAVEGGGVAGLREVDIGEAPVLAGERGERMEGLDDAGALRPTRADASGVGDDGAFAASEEASPASR